jgi:hypothetical protein
MADQKPKDIADNEDLLALLGDSQPEAADEGAVDIPPLVEAQKPREVPDIPDIPASIVPVPAITPPAPPVSTPVEATAIQQVDENSEYVRELLSDFKKMSKTLLGRFEEDRGEIQDVLDFLKDKVYNETGAPNEALVSALANTVRTKADSSANAVKLLDSYSKLLAAGKTTFGGNGGGGKGSSTGDMVDLAKLLLQDKFPDEE